MIAFPGYLMRRFQVLAILSAFLLWAGAAFAQGSAPLDRPAIEAIIKDYLLKNPEILEEAMTELQARRVKAEADQRAKLLAESREMIFNAPTDVVLGDPNGDVTLVEFFDYNCGYCKRALGDLVKLLEEDKKLRVVLKDYPVLGQGSVEAALVAVAVKQQIRDNKFLDFHKTLLLTRGPIAKDRALAVAKESGVDMAKLEKDMAAFAGRDDLAAGVKLGEALNLNGTPSYIMGEDIIIGAVGYDELKTKVAAMRKCGKTNCAGTQ